MFIISCFWTYTAVFQKHSLMAWGFRYKWVGFIALAKNIFICKHMIYNYKLSSVRKGGHLWRKPPAINECFWNSAVYVQKHAIMNIMFERA